MGSSNRTKAELLEEIAQLRKRVAALEKKSDRLKKACQKTREEFGSIEHAAHEWRKTVDTAENIIMLVNHKDEIMRANVSASKFFKRSFQEIIGTNCSQLFRGAGLIIKNCRLENLKETKKYDEEEILIPEKNVWLLITANPVMGAKGNLKEVVYTMYDVTEKIRLKNRLISEKKFNEYLINSLPGIFYLFHESGVFLKWNKNLEKVTGYSSEEIWKMHPLDFFGADEKQKVEERIREVFIKGASQVEARIVTKGGKAIPYFFTGSKVMEGGLPYLIGTGIDISDRCDAEEELARIKNDWEETFDTITDMIIIHDKDFNILRSNRTAAQILGLPFLEISKQIKCYEFYHGADCPPSGCPICECVQTGESAVFELFEPYLNRFLEIRAIPRYDKNNELLKLIHIVRDISERKKAEEKIREYAETLEEKVKVRTAELERATFEAKTANKAKSIFLTNMSHELRTPLNSVIGFSEALLAGVYGDVKEEHREYLQDILDSGTHLLSIISEILDLTKIETGRMELDREEYIVSELVRSSVTLFKEKARKHNIDFQVDIDEEMGTFFVDGTKVRQIFLNLLSNAFKFTPDNGSISVQAQAVKGSELDEGSLRKRGFEHGSVQPDEEYVQCSVDDTGPGISEENQLRLFKPFEQLEKLSDKKEGSGIGLLLTKRLVELHGGLIWCESPPQGKSGGSRFVFLLPRSVTDAKLNKSFKNQ